MGKKYDSLNGMRAYAAIAILAMHVLENSEYTGIASIVSTKVDLLKYGYLLVILLMTIASFYAWPQISGLVEPFVCLIVFSLWIIYAISVESIVLNNKWVTFISGISLEIYLCHMFVYRILEKMHILYILGRGYLAYVSMVFVTLFGSICVSLLSQKGIAKIESVVKRICEPK